VTRTAAAATPATPATKPVIPPNVVLSSFNNNPFKLNNLVKKPPSQAHQLNPNFNPLIPTNLNNYTTTVLAARAAAIAAANSVNLQIMQQANHLKPSSSTTMTMSSSNGVIVTQPLRPQGLTTTIYTNSHNAGVINTVTTTNPPQYNQQEMIAAKSAHLTEAQLNAEKEAEQKRLEEEMRKRRERIEKWRNEKKSKEEAKDNGSSMVAAAAGNDANKKVNNGNGKRIFF
jgi:isopentenyl diphosphate isomerase/L-lactate dehydrogenase-like FMN-dependent dehydrogenase